MELLATLSWRIIFGVSSSKFFTFFAGTTYITSDNVDTHLYDNFDHVVGFTDSPTNQGAFNNYASINANWADTTDFDNLRADGSGGLEVDSTNPKTFGNTVHTSSTNATTY